MGAATNITGLSPDKMKFFASFIYKKTGIVYDDTNLYQLENRLAQVAQSLSFASVEEMWVKAQSGISGLFEQVLLDIATNNETSFFRDKAVFEALVNRCIPDIRKLRPQSPTVRIWSAASSTGQEIYTVVMSIKENMDKLAGVNYEIRATDFSNRVLERARSGTYSQLEIQRGLPTKLLIKYFKKNPDETWTVDPSLRAGVTFEHLNLAENWPPRGTYDIILVRNVLIYQNTEGKKTIIKKMLDLLNPKGFLIMGGAESMMGLSDQFDQVTLTGAVVYQKKT